MFKLSLSPFYSFPSFPFFYHEKTFHVEHFYLSHHVYHFHLVSPLIFASKDTRRAESQGNVFRTPAQKCLKKTSNLVTRGSDLRWIGPGNPYFGPFASIETTLSPSISGGRGKKVWVGCWYGLGWAGWSGRMVTKQLVSISISVASSIFFYFYVWPSTSLNSTEHHWNHSALPFSSLLLSSLLF